MRVGLWIWPSFTLLDAYVCFVAYRGVPFPLFVAYRVAVELLFVAVYRASVRESTRQIQPGCTQPRRRRRTQHLSS